MAGRARADLLVARLLHGAAGIAGDGALDAVDVLVDGLDAPEAAAGDDRGLEAAPGRLVDCRRRKRHGRFGRPAGWRIQEHRRRPAPAKRTPAVSGPASLDEVSFLASERIMVLRFSVKAQAVGRGMKRMATPFMQ